MSIEHANQGSVDRLEIPAPAQNRSWKLARDPGLRPIIALVAFALLLRVVFILLFGLHSPIVSWGDDHVYDSIARGILEGRYDNYWFPPGYPVLLAAIYAVFGADATAVRLLQAVLGAATCGVVALVGRRLFGNRAGLIAGTLLAILPGHIYMTGRLMAETTFTFLVAWSLWLVVRFLERPTRSLGVRLGLALGAMGILKSNLILFPPLLLIWLAYRLPRGRRLVALAPVLVVFALVSLATPLANWIALGGKVSLLAGNSGTTLWLSNNPEANGYFVMPGAEVQASLLEDYGLTAAFESADDMQRNRVHRELALRWVLEHPGRVAILCLKKLYNGFSPFGHAEILDRFPLAALAHGITYGCLLPFVIGGFFVSLGRHPSSPVLGLLLGSFTVMVLIFYGTPRFTIMVMPVLTIWAGCALAMLYDSAMRLPRLASKFRVAAKIGSFAGITFVLVVLGGELGLRLFGYGSYVIYQPDPDLLWVPVPNQKGVTVAGHEPITINGGGLRYPVDLERQASDEVRVFAFGDSVTMGWGVDDASHLSAVLERLFREAATSPPVRVVSAGVNAYPTTLCVERFRKALEDGWQIDIAILLYSFNGNHEVLAELEERDRDRFLNKVLLKGIVRRSAIYNWAIEDVLRSLVYYRVRDRLVAGSWETHDRPGWDRIRGNYRASLADMRKTAARHGTKLAFVLLGSQDQRGDLNSFQRTFLEFAREEGIPVVDMPERLARENHEELFADHVHPSAAGHERIAQALFPVVRELILEAGPAPASLKLSPSPVEK